MSYYIGVLTADQQNRIFHQLAKKSAVTNSCDRCGSPKFGVLGRMHLPVHDPLHAETTKDIPTVIVACHDCGHLSLFALEKLFSKEDEFVL